MNRSRARRSWLVACLLAAWCAGFAAMPRQEPPDPEWRQRLETWVSAVMQHTPGEADAAAMLVGRCPEFDLDRATTDFAALLALYRRETARKIPADSIYFQRTPLSLSDVRTLTRLTDSDTGLAAGNNLLVRAAILHADVAMLVLPVLGRGYGCGISRTFMSADGSRVGSGCLVFHWSMARALLDAVRPEAVSDPAVRLWYHASSAYLLEHADYANGTPHLDYARHLFPRDPGILFEHGLLHEALAAPEVQSAIRGRQSSVGSAEANLREARESFGAAAKADPGFAEARVRYGRVLGALGQHQEAAVELRRALQQAGDSRLQYYAEMFLGDEERVLGNRDAAGRHYRRAAELVPQAQSPQVALGFLARQAGDRGGALAAVQRLLTLPPGRFTEKDPWWVYLRWQQRDAESLFRELYQPFMGEQKRP